MLLATSVSRSSHTVLQKRDFQYDRAVFRESRCASTRVKSTAVRLNTLLAWTRQQDGSNTSNVGITDNMYSARSHEVFTQHLQTHDHTKLTAPINSFFTAYTSSVTHTQHTLLVPTTVSPSFRCTAPILVRVQSWCATRDTWTQCLRLGGPRHRVRSSGP